MKNVFIKNDCLENIRKEDSKKKYDPTKEEEKLRIRINKKMQYITRDIPSNIQ